MRLKVLAALAATSSLTSVAGTGIIVPLYIFPGQSPACSAWTPLLSALVYHFHYTTGRDSPESLQNICEPLSAVLHHHQSEQRSWSSWLTA